MHTYSFESISLGQAEYFDVTITDKMLSAFQHITGDNNPLHTDRQFAAQHGYDDSVVYGMLTASFLSTLAGVYLPGRDSLIYEVNVSFVNPVYVGDRIRILGTVIDKNDTFRLFRMKVTITNQRGEKVLRGKMKVGVTDGKR